MTTSNTEARSRAAISFQALLSKHPPGSSPYRIAERALDLAFNGSCPEGNDFEHTLLEDARQILDRQIRAKLIDGCAEAADRSRCKRKLRPVSPRNFACGEPLVARVTASPLQGGPRFSNKLHGGGGHGRNC